MNDQANEQLIPISIKRASYLIFAAIGLMIIKNIMHHFITSLQVFNDPLNLIEVAFYTLLGFLGIFIGQGKNWARVLLTITFMLWLFICPIFIIRGFRVSTFVGPISILMVLLILIAIILLFQAEAKKWYNRHNQ